MLSGLLALTAVLTVVQGGQFSVLYTSPSVRFQATSDVLPESQVVSVIQSAFSLQTQNEANWRGMLAGNFFDRPQALILLSISGITADQLNVTSAYTYETLEDNPEPLNMQDVVIGLQELSQDQNPILFLNLFVDKRHRVHLETGDQLPHVTYLQLPSSNPKIYVELHAIKQTLGTLMTNFKKLQRDTPDLFHFHVSGLEYLVDRYGRQSQQVTQAITSLQSDVEKIIAMFRSLYKDDLAILALTQSTMRMSSYPSSLKARRLLQQTTPANELIADLNLAPEFTWMYPVMFNITLWFMITFFIIMFGVSWCIWFTDPGRDGVIYRMTTHHLKEA